jgi:lipoate-protein ligase A
MQFDPASPITASLPVPWRWIPPITAPGATQMAIDRWLLDQVAAGADPCLRLYRWSTPTLSLGRHQRRIEPHWQALAEQGRITLLRRPSGGRAVLHAGELTYALACRPASPQRQRAYRACCQWLLEAFAQLGVPLQWGGGPAGGRFVEAQGRSSCFATATGADLIHADGAKRIGSAQLWRGGLVLQHGSLLLDPPADLWQAVFGGPPPALAPLPTGGDGLEALLRRCAEAALCGGALRERPLAPEEWGQIEALEPL